jgi:hypothetical protein
VSDDLTKVHHRVSPATGDTVFVEPWERPDGKHYVTVGRVHRRAEGSSKPPRITRMAIPAEDWALFAGTVASYKAK